MHRLVRRFTGSLAIFALMLVAACGDGDPDLSGAYSVRGEPKGSDKGYSGRLFIKPFGEGYELMWRLEQGQFYRGAALQADSILGGVYWAGSRPIPTDLAIAVFRIGEGKLSGTWMPAGGNGREIGHEELVGPKMVGGTYRIASGTNPDGTPYSGTVEITQTGKTYRMRWYLPELTYVGRGIRVGDVLIVGYASEVPPGVVVYCMVGDDGKGMWSFGSERDVGTELITQSENKNAFGESSFDAVASQCDKLGV